MEFFTIRSLCSIARRLQVQSSQLILESCVNPRWIWMIGLLCLFIGKMVLFIGDGADGGPLRITPIYTIVYTQGYYIYIYIYHIPVLIYVLPGQQIYETWIVQESCLGFFIDA